MRILFSGLIAAGLLTSQIATAAECALPSADVGALDVAGLKTELMYIALTCNTRDQYNAFINKYKTQLNTDEHEIDNYFGHLYGRTGTKRHDDFTTNLANSQSQTGMVWGNRYCAHNVQVFEEVMALRSPTELAEFAAARATPSPALMPTCGTTTAEREPARRVARARHRS